MGALVYDQQIAHDRKQSEWVGGCVFDNYLESETSWKVC